MYVGTVPCSFSTTVTVTPMPREILPNRPPVPSVHGKSLTRRVGKDWESLGRSDEEILVFFQVCEPMFEV